jgi:hypothetical protein
MLEIPTDKLHKFIAVLGLAILLGGANIFYSQLEKKKDVDGLLVRLEEELAFRTNLMKLEQSLHDQELERLTAKQKAGIPLSTEDNAMMASLSEKYESDVTSYKSFIGDAVPKVKEAGKHQEYIGYFFAISVACMLGGVILAGFGFRSWTRASAMGKERRR